MAASTTCSASAVQVGLTATPRRLEVAERSREADADRQVNADNLRHFGEPVYEYDIGQGIEDGYLAACEIIRRDIFLDDKPRNEHESGVEHEDLKYVRSPIAFHQMVGRGTRLDPLCVWIMTQTTVVNQREELVATRLNHILVHRTPEEIAAGITHA